MLWRKEARIAKELEEQITANYQLYHRVFDGPDGEAVLKDLAKRCFDHATTLDDQPHVMAFREGRRSIYKYIDNLLKRDVKELIEDLTKG